MIQPFRQEHTTQRNVEQIVVFPVPRILKQIVEVVRDFPKESVLVPQFQKELEVTQLGRQKLAKQVSERVSVAA